MHCAFAKYEQGFKRKNEYLERRRVKRKEEVERGVQLELQKRGMDSNSLLNDKHLLDTIGGSGARNPNGVYNPHAMQAVPGEEDSSLQMIG